MSRERPILFNGAMVRAILSGQKTQTRRVLKQATGPSLSVYMSEDSPGVAELSWLHGAGPGHDVDEDIARVPCPFGQPGDRLWVRETWTNAWDEEKGQWSDPELYHYRADGVEIAHVDDMQRSPWIPSIHMPRRACRLVLEVTDVRVERLQALPDADWEAEGVCFCMEDPDTAAGRAFNEAEHYAIAGVSMRGTPEDHGMRAQFAEQGLDWDNNPWVWVVTFKVVTP